MDGTEMTENILGTGARNNGGGGMAKLTVVLVTICLLVSTIAIILAATSLSKEGTTINVGGSGVAGTTSSGKIVEDAWTFAIGHDGSNIEYIDDTTGTLRGFHVDILDAVCAQANKDCRLVWDVYTNCWDSQAGQKARGGPGLMSGWYDGCTGWFYTFERSLVFHFTNTFRKPYYGTFYVKQGNPNGFNPTNIRPDQKIGFGDGWATDEHCLARNSDTITGVPLSASQIVHYPSRGEMLAAANNNEVSAIFSNAVMYLNGELQKIGDIFMNCQRGGAAIMTRVDSTLNEWWDPAFDAIKQSGTYRDICARIDTEHSGQRGFGGDVICLD